MVEVVTIEKAELIRLIDKSISGAAERLIRSAKPPEIMTKAEVAKYLKKSTPLSTGGCVITAFRIMLSPGEHSIEPKWTLGLLKCKPKMAVCKRFNTKRR